MDKIFQLDSTESIKKMALLALHNYDLDWTQIRFNQLSDTATFIIETNVDGTFLLRIHSEMKKEAIDSELVWLESLYDKLKIVPLGIVDRNGSRTVTIDRGDGYYANASLMRWVEGAHVNSGITEDQAFKEGMIENYCHHAPDPRETKGLKEEQTYAQAILRKYLNGTPFLFNHIEV